MRRACRPRLPSVVLIAFRRQEAQPESPAAGDRGGVPFAVRERVPGAGLRMSRRP